MLHPANGKLRFENERHRLVAAFMAGDIDTFAKLVKAVKAKLRARPDRHALLSAWGKKGAEVTKMRNLKVPSASFRYVTVPFDRLEFERINAYLANCRERKPVADMLHDIVMAVIRDDEVAHGKAA